MSIDEARQIVASAPASIFDYLQPTEIVVPTKEARDWARRYLVGRRPLGEALESLNRAVYEQFTFASGSTTNSTPLATVWQQRKGVCQDFTHVMLSVLRYAKLPSRYVCGYIEAVAPPSAAANNAIGRAGRTLVGAIATHAWVEVLVPGMDWVALDPTNRQWCGERHIKVSHGRDFRDATPLRGDVQGHGQAEHEGQGVRQTPCPARCARSEAPRGKGRLKFPCVYVSNTAPGTTTNRRSASRRISCGSSPVPSRGKLVQKIEFTTNASATVQFRRDLFDNNFARCFYPDKEAFLFHDLIAEIELVESNPFDFLLDFDAADYPFAYDATTAARLQAYLAPPPAESGQIGGPALLPLFFWEKPSTPTPTVSVLLGLMDAIHTHIRYERRDEGAAHPPAETLRLGHGSCRDFGVLLAGILRELGLAAPVGERLPLRVRRGLRQPCRGGRDAPVDGGLPAWRGLDRPRCDQRHLLQPQLHHHRRRPDLGRSHAHQRALFQRPVRPRDDDRVPDAPASLTGHFRGSHRHPWIRQVNCLPGNVYANRYKIFTVRSHSRPHTTGFLKPVD